MIDTPQNSTGGNFCTLNPILKSYNTLTYKEGSLSATSASAGGYPAAVGTIGVSAGKWYFETLCTSTDKPNNDVHVGWYGDECAKIWDGLTDPYSGGGAKILYFSDNGNKNVDGTTSSYSQTFETGDIIGTTINYDDSEVRF